MDPSLLATLFSAGILGLSGWTLLKVSKHGETLAVIRQQLTPEGEKSLRATVTENTGRLTRVEARLSAIDGIAHEINEKVST